MSEKLKALREAYASGQGPAQQAKSASAESQKAFQDLLKASESKGATAEQIDVLNRAYQFGGQEAGVQEAKNLMTELSSKDPLLKPAVKAYQETGSVIGDKVPSADFSGTQKKLDDLSQPKQFELPSDFQTGLKSMQDQMRVASDSYNDRLKDLMDTFQASRADLLANIERVQNETGNFLNLEDASLKKELLDAEKTGADKYEILKRYATGNKIDRAATGEDQRAELNRLMQQARAEGIDEAFLKSIQDHADFDQINLPNAIKTLQKRMGDVQPVSKPLTSQQAEQPVDIEANLQSRTQEVIDTPAEKPTNINLDNALTQLSGLELDPKKIMEMPPTELLVNTLAAELKIINDPSIDKLFADQEASYKQGKRDAESDFNNTISEINKAIEGEDFVPTSLESLTAKVYADTKEQNLESIELEKDYRSKMFDLQMAEERKKRGRLDGYLKAKLYAMGAQESSAGLHVMSAQINAADTRLQ